VGEEGWGKRGGYREMGEERWEKRDGRREMGEERWEKRGGGREVGEERWGKRGGGREERWCKEVGRKERRRGDGRGAKSEIDAMEGMQHRDKREKNRGIRRLKRRKHGVKKGIRRRERRSVGAYGRSGKGKMVMKGGEEVNRVTSEHLWARKVFGVGRLEAQKYPMRDQSHLQY